MLATEIKLEISTLLKRIIRKKLDAYSPETVSMPFHYRLLGKDRYAMFSFLQSMNTTFGMSIWEQVAEILAKGANLEVERQYHLTGEIDQDTEALIRDIHFKLRKGEMIPDKDEETELIRHSIKPGVKNTNDPDRVVDLFIKIGDEENYFDITSVKPNMKEFAALKLKLLRWVGLRLSQDRNAKVATRLAIPYNPYEPEPYDRWTLKGLFDLNRGEILVGEEFWNFVSCDNIYEELLDVFKAVGDEIRDEIDEKFKQIR